jgi:hypothetical protein
MHWQQSIETKERRLQALVDESRACADGGLALFEVRSLVGRRGDEVRLCMSLRGDEGIRLAGRVPCRADVAGVDKRERLGVGFTVITYELASSLILSYRPRQSCGRIGGTTGDLNTT